eukprot:1143533-Pelagomonas_calceolata.AAC.1
MGIPRPRTQQGHPQKYDTEVCVVWSCSGDLGRWPGLESQNQNFLNLCFQTLHATPHRSPKLDSPAKMVCLTSLPSFKVDGRLADSGLDLPAKVSKRFLLQPLPPTPPPHCRTTKHLCLGG